MLSDSSDMNLVRFAHNWNNGMLEQWNNGLWASKNQYSNIPPFHYPIWPTWNMFHIKLLLFQQVIEIPIHLNILSITDGLRFIDISLNFFSSSFSLIRLPSNPFVDLWNYYWLLSTSVLRILSPAWPSPNICLCD